MIIKEIANSNSMKVSIKNLDIDNKDIIDCDDKYLYGRKKTIGFRKDKKLYKFVGLRDGYSKQLELTLSSIIIDGVDKIANNRINYTNITDIDNMVLHSINDIDIYNTVDDSNFRNIVKITEPFNSIEILYEVHLLGVSISNYSITNNGDDIINYIDTPIGEYYVVDDMNGNILFTFQTPITFDEDNKVYNNISHKLYQVGDILYYKKIVNSNIKTKLPLFIDVNLSFKSSDISTSTNIQCSGLGIDGDISWDNILSGNGTLLLNPLGSSTNSLIERNNYLINDFDETYDIVINDAELISPYDGYSILDFFIDEASVQKTQSNKFDIQYGDIIYFDLDTITTEEGNNLDFIINQYDISDNFLSATNLGIIIDGYNPLSTVEVLQDAVSAEIELSTNGIDDYYIEFKCYLNGFNDANKFYDVVVNREVLIFDTSDIEKSDIENITLSFNITNPNGNKYSIQRYSSYNNTVTVNDFDSYIGDIYTVFQASGTSFDIDLGQDIIDDYVNGDAVELMIREYDTDYNGIKPSNGYSNILEHNWSYKLNIGVKKKILTEHLILNFNLDTKSSGIGNYGTGVISSTSVDYDEAFDGYNLEIKHNSISSTYIYAAGYRLHNPVYNITRTFLNFDTSIINLYDNYVISSVKLNIKNITYNSSIVIQKGTQSSSEAISISDFNSFTDEYAIVEDISIDSLISVDMSTDVISENNTLFAIRNYDYDYDNTSGTVTGDYIFGIDFSNTTLEIEIEPIIIQGNDYYHVLDNTLFDVYANKNTPDGTIKWYSDSEYNNYIGSGKTLTLNSHFFNEKLYVIVVDDFDVQLSYNVLIITIEIIPSLVYDTVIREDNSIGQVVDIDSVYFKYDNFISGVTYVYCNNLGDIYDSENGGNIYNMYNTYDIIDKFYSNVHNIDIAVPLDTIDFNIKYKKINDTYIYEGTRILLYSIISAEPDDIYISNGVYVINSNLKLEETDELIDEETAYHYIANVSSGDYKDMEFHIKNN